MQTIEPNFRAGGVEGRPKASDTWRTPRQFYERLNSEFHFALDAACTTLNCLAPTGNYFDQGIDALSDKYDWAVGSDGKPIWLNPPYSKVGPWLEKASKTNAIVVCLVTCDPSTRWWRDWVQGKAAEVRFVIGRIKFETPEGVTHETKGQGGGTTTPSAVVIYRPGSIGTGYTYMNAR